MRRWLWVLALGLLWPPHAAAAECGASVWRAYHDTKLRRFPDSDAYFYATQHMEIDADGAPNAYHPQDKGLDAITNAGFPNGGWKGVLVADPSEPSRPFVQPDGEFAGYFVAKTSLQDKTRSETDPARYVDARTVPYIVFPGAFMALSGTGGYGDLAMVRLLSGEKQSPAVVADGGPREAPLGEVSIALAENLGGHNVNPRNGAGKPIGTFVYVIFPKSRFQPAWPVDPIEMERQAIARLSVLGGWDKIISCLR
jgi:hypothetical protein